ncbi:MAG: hypothetical protein IIB19_02600 [Chloroflexi bacterium]|nr:hypothetical protein [Chloroflexota bacterium]
MWKFLRSNRVSVVVLGVMVALAGLAVGCDPGAGLTWVNETDQDVFIYLGDDRDLDDFSHRLGPRSRIEGVATIIAVWKDVVVVRDRQGNILLRKEITWDELKAQDFIFVIRPEDIGSE